ncbi:MAG TPA: DinB family protein [Thermoanaerobaculia bacterium]|nr:DinB family protein [Thermoanaerobaculia bacterium]
MSQSQLLADQMERAFRGGAWHGPSVLEALAGVDAALAAARPFPGAKTIWELVRHLTVWNEVPRRRLDGEAIEDVPEEVDWPPIRDLSAAAWQAALAALEAAHEALHARVLDLADDQLDEPVPGSDPTVRGMLLGVLQHNAYHAGQIVLLRKAQGGERSRT